MTSKDAASVAVTNNMKTPKDRIHQEPKRKGLDEHKAEKGVGASGGTCKDSKAPECDCRHRFLLHVLWAVLATLVVSFAIGQLELASIRRPFPSTAPLRETHGASTIPTSLWQGTEGSSPFPSSHAALDASAILSKCTRPPQNQTHIIMISSACSCLFERSIESREPVVKTVVRKNRELVSSTGVLLNSLFRQR